MGLYSGGTDNGSSRGTNRASGSGGGGGYLFLFILTIVATFFVWLIMRHHIWWSQVVAYVICATAFVVVVRFLIVAFMAPNNILFTILEPSTAAWIMNGNEPDHAIINKTGYKLNENNRVIPLAEGEKSKKRRWGSIYYVGFTPKKRYVYRFVWEHLRGDEVHSHDEVLDYVPLFPDMYVKRYKIDDKPVEDINGFGFGVSLVLNMMITKVDAPIFELKGGWLPFILGLVTPGVTNFVSHFRAKEDITSMSAGENIESIQEKKGRAIKDKKIKPGTDLREILWDFIVEAVSRGGATFVKKITETIDGVVTVVAIEVYGVLISQKGTTLTDTELPENMQTAATAQYIAEEEGKGKVAAAELTGQAFGKEVAEPVEKIGRTIAGLPQEGTLTADQAMKLSQAIPEAWENFKNIASINKLNPGVQTMILNDASGAFDQVKKEVLRKHLPEAEGSEGSFSEKKEKD